MASSADYRTIARSVATDWVRARLMSDEKLGGHLWRAMEEAIATAKRLAELELHGDEEES